MRNHATGVTVTCDVTKGGCELVTEEVDHKDAYAFEKTVQTEKLRCCWLAWNTK